MANLPQTGNIQIRLRNLGRSYTEGEQQHNVLNNVHADFLQGESVAIRGRSGSGKSTLLNLISGIDAPDTGQVEVAGLNITTMTERDRTLFRRKHIGFVYQSFNLVPTLTVADNIRLVLELNNVPPGEAADRIDELLRAVDLAERAGSYPDVLSGGEQQRVAIARALCHRPSILLADEPTGNLDDKTAETVLQLLDTLVRKTGGTMIVATHSATVASFCDRSMQLHDGKLHNVELRDGTLLGHQDQTHQDRQENQ
jgi:putative ABC transport system ATP-binding protein